MVPVSPPLLPQNAGDYFIGDAYWIEIIPPNHKQTGEIGMENSKKRKTVGKGRKKYLQKIGNITWLVYTLQV